MDFTEYNLGFCNKGEVAEITLSSAANVILLDYTNLHKYKNSMKFEYHGGHANVSPYKIKIPESGTWYVVIDGYSGTIKASVSVVE
jgi:Domain of unknown function (DUF1883).